MEWVCCPAAKHRKPLPLDFSTSQLCLDYFSLPVFLYFKTNFYCILKQTFTFLISTSFYDHASLFWKGFYNSSVLCEENSKALLRSLHFLIWEAKITKIRAHTGIAHKYCSFGWCLTDLQNAGISK